MVHQPEFPNKATLCPPETVALSGGSDNPETLKDAGTPSEAPKRTADERPGVSGPRPVPSKF